MYGGNEGGFGFFGGASMVPWTPNMLPSLIFRAVPRLAQTSGGNITSLPNAIGGALSLTGTGAVTLDAVHTLNGYSAINLPSSTTANLKTSSAALSGAAAHALGAVATIVSSPASYASWWIAGPTSGTAGANSVLGTNTNALWSGGSGLVSPIATPTPSGAAIFWGAYTGTTKILYVDGAYHSSATIAYNLQSGFGFNTFNAASATTAVYDYDAVFVGVYDPTYRAMDNYVLWGTRAFALQRSIAVTGTGDSLLAGVGLATPSTQNPLYVASTNLGITASSGYNNVGISGNTSTQMYTRFANIGDALDRCPKRYTRRVLVIEAGSNDAANLVSVATYASNINAMVAAGLARGFTHVVLCTIAARTYALPAYETRRQELNTWLYASGYHLADWAATFTDPTNATWYQGDETHFNATGATVAGGIISDAINALP